jgi:phosphomannomutase
MAVDTYARGETVSQHLTHLYDSYGHFISRQGYVTVPDPSLTIEIFARLREGGALAGKYPAAIGKYKVAHVRDLTTGFDSSTSDLRTTLPASLSSQHLTFTFENGCTANLRGSGTEPKLKYYVELHGSDRDKVRRLRVSVGWGCGRDGCACMSRTCVFRGDLCLVSCMSRTCVLCDLCLVRETRKTQ